MIAYYSRIKSREAAGKLGYVTVTQPQKTWKKYEFKGFKLDTLKSVSFLRPIMLVSVDDNPNHIACYLFAVEDCNIK